MKSKNMARFAPFRNVPLGITAALAALAAPCAFSAEVVLKLIPNGADAAGISALAARHGLSTSKQIGKGEWTVSSDNANVLRALRDDARVLWAEHAAAAGAADALPRVHPRMVRVEFNESAVLDLDNAKSRWLPELKAAAQKELRLTRIRDRSLSVSLPRGATEAEVNEAMTGLRTHPEVARVERMNMMRPLATKPFAPYNIPNDPFYDLQWPLYDLAGGIGAPQAWSLAGTSPITVAVLDTGYTDHPDLNAKWVPGYDFIRDRYFSVDGNGLDGDPSDEGDFEDYDACGNGYRYGSSWHGTHVAGIIGAQANNGEGIAGVAPNSRILPIRVLGRCGGFDDDVADGIRWAAGGSVTGVPNNPNPAKVLNLSLGGEGRCEPYVQDAIDYALSRGASVVVSAGNSADDAQRYSPANCKGVITVGANDRYGQTAEYSNLGPSVEISAPGGGQQGFNQVLSTLNAGSVGASGIFYQGYQGTSMAAPHVAGTIALMLTRDPALTPGRIVNILQNTSIGGSNFNSDECATSFERCIAGQLNAAAAVAAVVDRRHASEITSAPGRVRLIEMWNRANNSFMMTSDITEAHALLSGARGGDWVRSGQVADTFDFTAQPLGVVEPQPVCRVRNRFNGVVRYAANQADCNALAEAGWVPDGFAFMAALANGGLCAAGSTPVYEFEAGGRYRYAMSEGERNQSIRFGWQGGNVVFCVPAQ
jgi:subtilisin family serine protease